MLPTLLAFFSALQSPVAAAPLASVSGVVSISLARILSPRWEVLPADQVGLMAFAMTLSGSN